MKQAWTYVSGLLDLPSTDGAAERRSLWRQSMASLARAASEGVASPLEGMHADAIAKGIKAAAATGLLDDLDWLAPSAAASALYAVAASLPSGPEQREVGRRVLTRMSMGTAETVLAVATRMAARGKKGLAVPGLRTRIALAVELPLSEDLHDGPFALAVASDRELAREWLALPSTGSLPARRMAARLLERAAREASRRALQGDTHAIKALRAGATLEAWYRLLRDRESLVWRHVAVARGLVAPWVPELAKEARTALFPELTPTEWRRGATTIAAMLATAPEMAMPLLTAGWKDATARDPGVTGAFMWGIPRALESEPEAAAKVLQLLATVPSVDGAEGLYEAMTEFGPTVILDRLREPFARALTNSNDDGAAALAAELRKDLARKQEGTLRRRIDAALATFAREGSSRAHAAAREILHAAGATARTLEGLTSLSAEERRSALAIVRDFDLALLERDVLGNLLALGEGPAALSSPLVPDAGPAALESVKQRVATWIIRRESERGDASHASMEAGSVPAPERAVSHLTLRLRRLRALLHLLDGEVDGGEDTARAPHLLARWVDAVRALALQFDNVPPAALRRTLLAALGRALDALVRGGAIDSSDVLLFASSLFEEAADFATLAEASMDPDLVHVFDRYAEFSYSFEMGADRPSTPPPLRSETGEVFAPPDIEARLEALLSLANDVVVDGHARAETLRTALLRLHEALRGLARAPSFASLASSGSDTDVATLLEQSLMDLHRLAAGARSRLDPDAEPLSIQTAGETFAKIISPLVAGTASTLDLSAVMLWAALLTKGLPKRVVAFVRTILDHLAGLPAERPSIPLALVKVGDAPLPAWVPPRRMLGGFYLVRALGSGASGSVFLVRRHEERTDPSAEKFALKVPDYSATAARLLSEAEFLDMFRSEASALLAIPPHPNLARFVTFDLGAKPKPILVMEFIEGATLEQVIDARTLSLPRALLLLDDVLCGLVEMHAVGVGHLDLKPSNVVLRRGVSPVLVDFGLAGRHVRPGCATGPYGAPEVWGANVSTTTASPAAADVYAFGCLAFEVLTGQILFEADSETAQIAMHIAHDGVPPRLRPFAARSETAPIAELLYTALRRNPGDRASAATLRDGLRTIGRHVSHLAWPL